MLAAIVEHKLLFKRWKEGAVDVARQPATPLPLLILCALRYLGRGWTFDDLSEIQESAKKLFMCSFMPLSHTAVPNCTNSM